MGWIGLLGRVGGCILAFVLLLLIFTGPFDLVLGRYPVAMETISDVAALAAILLASAYFARRFDHRALSDVGFSLDRVALLSSAGLLLGGVMSAAAMAGLYLTDGWQGGEGVRVSNAMLAALTLIGMVCNVTFQEGLVRGYVFDTLRRALGGAAAVAITAILFVGMHSVIYLGGADVPFIAANLLLAGIALGLAVLWTGSIWCGVGMHYAWNLFDSLVYGRSAGVALFAGFEGRWIHLAPQSVEGSYAGLAGPALGIVLLCLWRLIRGPLEHRAHRGAGQ